MKSPRLALAAATLVLLSAACGGSDKDKTAGDGATPTAGSSASAPIKGGKPGSSATPSAPRGTASRPAGSGKATTGPTGGSTTTGGAGTTTSGGQAGASTVGTKAGAYTYDFRGTATAFGQSQPVSGTATLHVDPAAGDRQHSSLDGEQGKTQQDVIHTSAGTMLARLQVSSQAGNSDFRPAKPVLAMPTDTTPGHTWSWSMTSTDGKTKADFTGRMVGKEVVTVGGMRVETITFDSTLKLSGQFNGSYSFTQKGRTNYDPKRLLQVKTHSQTTVIYNGAPAGSGDTTQSLRSLNPT